MEKIIKQNPIVGEDKENDHNNIEGLMLTGYLLKTLKLVIIILNFSYFLGLIWLIFCEITTDFLKSTGDGWNEEDFFFDKFGITELYK
jgi:hypothetical protein